MPTEHLRDRAEQLGSQLLDAMKTPDAPAALEARKREDAAASATLAAFYAESGQGGQSTAVVARARSPVEVSAQAMTIHTEIDHALAGTLIASGLGVVAAGMIAIPQLASGMSITDTIALIAVLGALLIHARSYVLQRRARRAALTAHIP